MSQENVEILRAAIERFLAGTSESDREDMLTKGAEGWDPEIELDASDAPVLDISGVYRGRRAVQQFWREWLAAWETIRFEYQLVDAGDRVVQLFDLRMRGRSTGIEFPFGKLAWVYRVRNGLVVHQQLYMSHSAALEAVGLSEQGAENVEIVREQFAATNRKDFARPMADWADDVELTVVEELGAGTYAGGEAVGEFFGDWFRAFGAGIHFDVQEIVGAGEVVAVRVHHRARGRHSGAEVKGDFFYEYCLREGKIVRIKFHRSWQDALEALSPSEREAHSESP